MEKFYDTLREHMNEDGYVTCSIFYAGTVAQATNAAALKIAIRLQDMGCIKIYEMKRQSVANTRPGTTGIKGGSHHRIVKVLKPLSEEAYDTYWSNTFERK